MLFTKKINRIVDEKIANLLFANNNKLYNYIYKNDRQFYKVSKEQFLKDMIDKYKNNYMSTTEFDRFVDMIYNSIKLPKRATDGSAGYDFRSPYNFSLSPNEEIIIPTGIKASMNKRDFLEVVPRSSLGFKYKARLLNTLGIVDSDYYNNPKNEGHMFVALRNEGNKSMYIEKGEAFCQGIFIEYGTTRDDDVNDIRQGGIGSTNGKK